MIEIFLKDGQSAYSVVAEYIKRYWERNRVDTVVFSVYISHDGTEYVHCNEIADYNSNSDDVEFLYDWWKGEKYIKLSGIQSIDNLDVSGGIYES